MLSVGQQAPEFELPGVAPDGSETFSLSDSLNEGNIVLLLFYPFDFSPVCTNELCAMRDAEWFQFTPDLDVWGISGDSTYAHQAFVDEYELNFPLLSDFNGTISGRFDIRYDRWEGHEAVPKRAVFVIDTDRMIRYAWATDHAYQKPDFLPIKDAIEQLDDPNVPDDVSIDVDYDHDPTP